MRPIEFLKYGIFSAALGLASLITGTLRADTAAPSTGNAPVSLATPSGNSDYQATALPILKQSCFACHGPRPQSTDNLDPALKKKADKTIAKAQSDYPMGDTFPFPGSQDPKKDLKDFVKEIQKGKMPPKSQKVFGLGSPLSDSDKKALLDWAAGARKALN